MERLALSAEEQQQVYADCAIPAEDCDKPLSVQAFTALAEQLRKSSVYRNFVQEKSQAAEAAAMTYLEQAGLLRDVRLGIVDSGWNGSMQNCLMTLLEKGAGKPLPNLKGYYFGLYTEPKQGTWEAWYFDPLTPLKKSFDLIIMSMSVCVLHRMGQRWAIQSKKMVWQFLFASRWEQLTRQMQALAEQQERICLAFTERVLPQVSFSDFASLPLADVTESLLQRLLFRPTAEEAQAFGQFQFCDDMGEMYAFPLASAGQEAALKQGLLSQHVLQHFHHVESVQAEPFWVYGSLACSQIRRKRWYHWNFACWDWIRHAVNRRRGH